MSNRGITTENLLLLLPEALTQDPHIRALAEAYAKAMEGRLAEIDRMRTVANLNGLDEKLLDILAYDFKVDWYGYDYPVEAKRELLKSSFQVHRKMGTKGAVERALSAIYPGTKVEEWFTYGGEPFGFRIILDITKPNVQISNDEILRAVDMYKSLRSHLEEGGITYRSRVHIVVGTAWGYTIYSARRCGTYPQVATRGGIARELVVVETAEGRAVYSAPMTGETVAGTHPQTATQGGQVGAVVIVEGLDGQVVYAAPTTGETVTGTHPQTATKGGAGEGGLTFTETAGSAGVYARPCGSPPGAL